MFYFCTLVGFGDARAETLMLFQERMLKIADQYLGSGTIPSLTQMMMLTSATQSQKSQHYSNSAAASGPSRLPNPAISADREQKVRYINTTEIHIALLPLS